MCVVGALALYLWFRFDQTREMENPPNFVNNEDWFFIKLLVSSSCTTDTNTEQFDIRNYANSMDEILRFLNIFCSHRAHFGRKAGPMLLELQEVSKSIIEALGNWNQTQQEEAYSAQLPMLAMRVMAGFLKERGSVFVKRQTKPESEAGARLRANIFPWYVLIFSIILLYCGIQLTSHQFTLQGRTC